jgi:CRP-like cAMP-binding protein
VRTAKHLVLFQSLPEDDFQLLVKKLKPKSFKKGAPLVEVGAVQRELYFIKGGIQMAYFNSLEKDYVMAFTQCPDLCAIPDSFSFQTPSHFRLVAITASEVDSLAFLDLQTLFDQSPALERLFRKMTEKILAGMITRHVELHSLSMEERFKAFCTRSPHLLQEVPHKYLASYLGIDPTNFSKLFNSVRI